MKRQKHNYGKGLIYFNVIVVSCYIFYKYFGIQIDIPLLHWKYEILPCDES